MENTEIICIIDRSGSMQDIRDDAIGSFNAFLEEQKKADENILITIALFDDQYDLIHNGVKISKVKPFTTSSYVPRGSTALYDAIGRTIAGIDARLSETNGVNRDENITIAILTDGQENSSREFSREQILKIIEDRTEKRGWDFIYLSADPKAFDDARGIGIKRSNVMCFTKDSEGIACACSSMSKAMEFKRKGGNLNEWKD
jgi:uncharacterized protein YegL